MRATDVLRGAVRTATPALALATAGLAVACADGPTAPVAPTAAAFGKAGPGGATAESLPTVAGWIDGSAVTQLKATLSGVQAQYTVGDTVVTLMQVGTDAKAGSSFNIGLSGKLSVPRGAASICDPGTSSYGAGTWDQPCAVAARPVRIAAKTWIAANGKVATEFAPALRFAPEPVRGVTLTLKDPALAGTRVDYCVATGCVDEAAADLTLATQLDRPSGFVVRRIKHFSGYIVVANRKGGPATDPAN